MAKTEALTSLAPGTRLLVGGDRLVTISEELARSFQPGDALAVVPKTGEVLHIPAAERAVAARAVDQAVDAFRRMSTVTDEQIVTFFTEFAARLDSDEVWEQVSQANARDVADAKSRGRSTTRLEVSDSMRRGMIDGLRGWLHASSLRGKLIERVDHGTWSAELVGAELGVVAFVFEGRPNVVADATGVLRSGNTVVFRIGRDALGTARAILDAATIPALQASGLPQGAVSLVQSSAHAAGWALFQDTRLALAAARGSGPAVATLGSLAQAAGIPVSLHGTGGAWLVASTSVKPEHLTTVVADSLDRKVCNTLNTCVILREQAEQLVPAFLEGLRRAADRRSTEFKLHVARGSEQFVPTELFERQVGVERAEGIVQESQAESIGSDQLGVEWEWENSPEVTLKIVEHVADAVALFNAQSPQFVACLLSDVQAEHEEFYRTVNAPFVGDGFTRWVDGQYALNRPELGLSNWENGRLFSRGGVLSGSSVFTIRTRVRGTSRGRPR